MSGVIMIFSNKIPILNKCYIITIFLYDYNKIFPKL